MIVAVPSATIIRSPVGDCEATGSTWLLTTFVVAGFASGLMLA
jgi:hypothetical protein